MHNAHSQGVRWSWIDQLMYEQSPFTIKDLMKQRRRWFHGIALCCVARRLPLRVRTGSAVAGWRQASPGPPAEAVPSCPYPLRSWARDCCRRSVSESSGVAD